MLQLENKDDKECTFKPVLSKRTIDIAVVKQHTQLK